MIALINLSERIFAASASPARWRRLRVLLAVSPLAAKLATWLAALDVVIIEGTDATERIEYTEV